MAQDDRHQTAKLYLDRPLEDLLSELEMLVEESRPRRRGGAQPTREARPSFWKSLEPRLWQKICVEWKWCERRGDAGYQNKENLVIALSEVLAGLVLPTTIPVILLATILAKMGLDKFCKCAKV